MKRIHEMNDAEILALTDDQITKLIDYECALEGVPLLPPTPGDEPKNTLPEPDTTCYFVGGVLTTDKKLADKIYEVLTSGSLVTTDYSRDYNNKYLKPLNPEDYSYPAITIQKHRSKKQWAACEDQYRVYKEAKNQYDEIKQLYDEASKSRQNVIDQVYDKINFVRSVKNQQDYIRTEFARYLELAENNATIAMNFLLKAKPAAKDHPDLIEELCPGYKL
jgi:hypothetical protein